MQSEKVLDSLIEEEDEFDTFDEELVTEHKEPTATKTEEKNEPIVYLDTPPLREAIMIEESPGLTEAEESAKKKRGHPKNEGPKKLARKPLDPKDKFIRSMMRKADIDAIPELNHLMREKSGTKVRIGDIGIFTGSPKEDLLKKIYKNCPIKNRVNLSAEIELKQVRDVGIQILASDCMYQPIQLAKIDGDETIECTSGRHRLVLLALLYGTDSRIPVYMENRSLNEARDAVVVANQSRKTRALEKAEHTILQAVGGDASAKLDEIYERVVTTKAKSRKYCTYNVIERGHPKKLNFKISSTPTRSGGELTTITNLEGFWTNATAWYKSMPRTEFDMQLSKAIEFINELVKSMCKNEDFDEEQHLSSMTLNATGKYFKTLEDAGYNAIADVLNIANTIISMGSIGRQKSDQTYDDLVKQMRT